MLVFSQRSQSRRVFRNRSEQVRRWQSRLRSLFFPFRSHRQNTGQRLVPMLPYSGRCAMMTELHFIGDANSAVPHMRGRCSTGFFKGRPTAFSAAFNSSISAPSLSVQVRNMPNPPSDGSPHEPFRPALGCVGSWYEVHRISLPVLVRFPCSLQGLC